MLTLGASKHAGQFSDITGNFAFSANCLKWFSLTNTNGRMTLKSPSLEDRIVQAPTHYHHTRLDMHVASPFLV